jgi:RNA polymerase sigma factor (sigma-70 family)
MQDETLINGMKRGEKTSFQSLVRLYERDVYGYLRARLLEHGIAEEMTQKVFERFLEGLPRMTNSTNLRASLLEIAANLLRREADRLPGKGRRAWLELCQTIDREPEIRNNAESQSARDRVSEGLTNLGSSSRQVLEMTYAANQSPAEIGKYLKRSEASTRSLIASARQALLRYLAPDGHSPV